MTAEKEELVVKEYSQETWVDFDALFGKHKGVRGGCCIFVDKHRRQEGLSQFALHAPVELIRQNGGGVVESYPVDVPGVRYPPYTGSEKMYQREGFETVARLGKITLFMRLIL
jgi:hypothetical protein